MPIAMAKIRGRSAMGRENDGRSLSAWTEPVLPTGTVLRFPASYPYEDVVDFMVVRLPAGEPALLVTTGLKSGLVAQVLPDEAGPAGGGVSTGWLKENWRNWGWPTTPASDVLVLRGYPLPASGAMEWGTARNSVREAVSSSGDEAV